MGASAAIIGAAVIGAGASAYSANQAGKSADKMAESQAGLADQQAGMSREQWERYKQLYNPMEATLASEASKPLTATNAEITSTPGFLQGMAKINENAGNGYANLRRSFGARLPGVSGMETSANIASDVGAAGQRANMWTAGGNAAIANKQQRLTNMANVLGSARGIPGQAMSGMNSAAGNYGNLAGMYGNSAAAGWQGVGNSLSNLATMYMLNNYMNKGA